MHDDELRDVALLEMIVTMMLFLVLVAGGEHGAVAAALDDGGLIA